jgi:hypothetical protein
MQQIPVTSSETQEISEETVQSAWPSSFNGTRSMKLFLQQAHTVWVQSVGAVGGQDKLG